MLSPDSYRDSKIYAVNPDSYRDKHPQEKLLAESCEIEVYEVPVCKQNLMKLLSRNERTKLPNPELGISNENLKVEILAFNWVVALNLKLQTSNLKLDLLLKQPPYIQSKRIQHQSKQQHHTHHLRILDKLITWFAAGDHFVKSE